jgi:hypothetical protein
MSTMGDSQEADRNAALMQLIRSVIEKRGVGDATQRETAVSLVAIAARIEFPERAWERYGSADEELENFIAIALIDLGHTGWFENTTRFFQLYKALKLDVEDGAVPWDAADNIERMLRAIVAKDPNHPLSKHYASWLSLLTDRSGYIMRIYAVGLAASAPVAALVAVVLTSVATKIGAPFAADADVQDLIGALISGTMFYPVVYFMKRVQTARTPVVPREYLPMLILLALLIFVEFRLATELFVGIQLGLPFSFSASFGSLLVDARQRWLYSAPFVVIGLSLLQHLRFIGKFVPEALEDWDQAASAFTAVVIAVIAIAVSAVIKLLLMIAT